MLLASFKEVFGKILDFLGHTIYKTKDYELTILNLVIFVLVLILTRYASRIFEGFYKRTAVKQNDPEAGSKLAIMQITKYAIYIAGALLALQSLGVNLTLVLAGSAALFVGIGFALQQTFRDLIAGLILLFEGSVKIGDVIQSEELVGVVKKIGLRTSAIETKDKISVIVPNSLLTDRQFINYSFEDPYSRFQVTVGVAYGSDVNKVRQLLLEIAEENQEITNTPEPAVLFKDFADSALVFDLFFTTRNLLFVQRLRSDLRFAIDKKFRENNIHIPFPQRDIHIRSGLKPALETLS